MKKLIRNCHLHTLLLFCFLSGLSSLTHADVILHAFDWRYDEVEAKASEIANLGYKKVLVAPPIKSSPDNCYWWARYQPQDLRVIDHCLGNKQSFQSMINALTSAGVATYADIVLNHMANERNNSLQFPGSDTLTDYSDDASYWQNQTLFGNLSNNLFGASDFHPQGCIFNYNSVFDVQYWRICGGNNDPGLPDLDPNNWVREQQRSYLQALKNMGVTGFRIDAAKHMTLWHINQIFTQDIINNMHIFGELITTGGASSADYQSFLGPYLQYTNHAAYDFPLLNTLVNTFKAGGSMSALENPFAYGNALANNRAVTVAITHDIPTNDGFRYLIMNAADEHLANTYILGRNGGTPMVFSDKTGVDNNRWVDDYKQNNLAQMVFFHNRVQGQGQSTVYFDDCVLVFKRGMEGLVGINKCGGERWVELQTNNQYYWYRNYRDVFTGEIFSISNNSHWVRIPGRASRMWYAD